MENDIGRNDPCHCGSKKKYKKCHFEKDEVANRKKREKDAIQTAKRLEKEAKDGAKEAKKKEGHKGHQDKSWIQKAANKMGFMRRAAAQQKAPPSNKGG